jgi:hypothetical protein
MQPNETSRSGPSAETPKTSLSLDRTPPENSGNPTPARAQSQTSSLEPSKRQATTSNPLAIYNGQSWAFWNNNTWREQLSQEGKLQVPSRERPDLLNRVSTISKLSSEASVEEDDVKCKKCGSEEFKVRVLKDTFGMERKRLVCGKCGTPAD